MYPYAYELDFLPGYGADVIAQSETRRQYIPWWEDRRGRKHYYRRWFRVVSFSNWEDALSHVNSRGWH